MTICCVINTNNNFIAKYLCNHKFVNKNNNNTNTYIYKKYIVHAHTLTHKKKTITTNVLFDV